MFSSLLPEGQEGWVCGIHKIPDGTTDVNVKKLDGTGIAGIGTNKIWPEGLRVRSEHKINSNTTGYHIYDGTLVQILETYTEPIPSVGNVWYRVTPLIEGGTNGSTIGREQTPWKRILVWSGVTVAAIGLILGAGVERKPKKKKRGKKAKK